VTGVLLSLLAIVIGLMNWIYGAGAVQAVAPFVQIFEDRWSLDAWQILVTIVLAGLNILGVFFMGGGGRHRFWATLGTTLALCGMIIVLPDTIYNLVHGTVPVSRSAEGFEYIFLFAVSSIAFVFLPRRVYKHFLFLPVLLLIFAFVHIWMIYDLTRIAEPLLQILKSLNGWQIISIVLSLILLLVLNFQIIFRQTRDNEDSFPRALAKMLIIFALEGALIQVMYNVAHVARPLVQVAAYVKFDNAETLGILINITMLIMLNVLVVSWHVGERINSFWGAIMKYPLVDFMLLGMIYGSIHAITWIIRAPVNLESFLPIIVAVLSATVSAAILAKLADFNKLSNGSSREAGEVSFLAGCAYWLVAVALLLFIFRLIQGFS
jgi:hypothetical protein